MSGGVLAPDMPALVDAHFHLDLLPHPERLVRDIERDRVYTIAVTNAPSVFFHTRELCRGTKFVRAAVGLHPELVHSHGRELDHLWPHLDETRYVGEVGLDYVTGDEDLRRRQRAVFSEIVARCAGKRDKVLTVHSRRAAADVLGIVGKGFPGSVILHWFSGSQAQLREANRIGCWFSVNPAMVQSPSGRKLIANMPPERVLTETDGPFVKTRGRAATPVDVADAVAALASLWRVTVEECASIVLGNFRRLLAERAGSDESASA
jgi:TatD DNase family protein